MIYYPIQTLVDAGIKDILLVCGGNSAGEFLRILGNGEQFGLKHLHYTYQSEPRGIADALALAEEFVDGKPMCVILADNILQKGIKGAVDEFLLDPNGATIFGAEVAHPECYGVIVSDEHGNVTKVVEKPKNPESNLACIGVYLYDSTVWHFIEQLEPSARGELEITDVNNHFLEEGRLKVKRLEGEWFDCGENIEGYMEAQLAARRWSK